jgi:hypothetical protein
MPFRRGDCDQPGGGGRGLSGARFEPAWPLENRPDLPKIYPELTNLLTNSEKPNDFNSADLSTTQIGPVAQSGDRPICLNRAHGTKTKKTNEIKGARARPLAHVDVGSMSTSHPPPPPPLKNWRYQGDREACSREP